MNSWVFPLLLLLFRPLYLVFFSRLFSCIFRPLKSFVLTTFTINAICFCFPKKKFPPNVLHFGPVYSSFVIFQASFDLTISFDLLQLLFNPKQAGIPHRCSFISFVMWTFRTKSHEHTHRYVFSLVGFVNNVGLIGFSQKHSGPSIPFVDIKHQITKWSGAPKAHQYITIKTCAKHKISFFPRGNRNKGNPGCYWTNNKTWIVLGRRERENRHSI